MKFQKPKYEIWEQGPYYEDMYTQCERVARVCYDSHEKSKGTLESGMDFTQRMIKSGHGEMLEHMTVYLKIVGNPQNNWIIEKLKNNPYTVVNYVLGDFYVTTNYRVIMQGDYEDYLNAFENGYDKNWVFLVRDHWCDRCEHHEKRVTVYTEIDRCTGESFIRHRVFSKARQSTRWCNYTKDKYSGITCMWPCWDMTLEQQHTFECALESAEKYYTKLIKLGWTPEQARLVLPFDVKSPLVMTGTMKQWKKFLKVRADGAVGRPHPQALEIAVPLKKELFG